MRPISSNNFVDFYRFVRLFNVSLFSVIEAKNDKIYAKVAWLDECISGLPAPEDAQEVVWDCKFHPAIDDALIVGEYAYDMGWINIDKLSVNRDFLTSSLRWSEDRIDNAIDILKEIRVSMMDNGEEVDFLALHE